MLPQAMCGNNIVGKRLKRRRVCIRATLHVTTRRCTLRACFGYTGCFVITKGYLIREVSRFAMFIAISMFECSSITCISIWPIFMPCIIPLIAVWIAFHGNFISPVHFNSFNSYIIVYCIRNLYSFSKLLKFIIWSSILDSLTGKCS